MLRLVFLFLGVLHTLFHYLLGNVYCCWKNQGNDIPPFAPDWLLLQSARKVFIILLSCVFLSVFPYQFCLYPVVCRSPHLWLMRANWVFVLFSCFVCADHMLITSVTSVMYILHFVAFLSWFSSISFLNRADSVFLLPTYLFIKVLCPLVKIFLF